jgi:hypothetical protein
MIEGVAWLAKLVKRKMAPKTETIKRSTTADNDFDILLDPMVAADIEFDKLDALENLLPDKMKAIVITGKIYSPSPGCS